MLYYAQKEKRMTWNHGDSDPKRHNRRQGETMTAEVLFGKLAGFHSASWRDFIRQVGGISFGKLA